METFSRYLSGLSIMAKIGYIFGFAILMLVVYVTIVSGVLQGDIDSYTNQTLAALCIFYIPALLLAFLFHTHEETTFGYLSQDRLPSLLLALLAVVAIVSAIPFINAMSGFNQWICPQDKELGAMMENLAGGSLSLYLLKLLVIAFVPALSEEMFFRGLLQNTLVRHMSPWIAIATSALVFSLAHGDMSGALPRFFLGYFLGWLVFRSGSLWLSILVHFINNAIIVTSYHFSYDKVNHNCFIDNQFSIGITILGTLVMCACIYGLHRFSHKQDTIKKDAV